MELIEKARKEALQENNEEIDDEVKFNRNKTKVKKFTNSLNNFSQNL